jgi:hypothetical protein
LVPSNPRGSATGDASTELESATAAVGRCQRPDLMRTSPRPTGIWAHTPTAIRAIVTPADLQDHAAFRRCCSKPNASPHAAVAKVGIIVDVVSGPKPGHRIIVQPRRWVVERTNGWINRCPRLDRHYEVTLQAHEGLLILSQIALLRPGLDRSQLFDTL